MSQVVKIMRGIPGSGKSTEALNWLRKDPRNRARVNRDAIRIETFGNAVLPPELETAVTKIQLATFELLVAQKKSVIVDDTNLRAKSIKPFLEIAARYDVPVIYQDIDVDLKVALERNKSRERQVPEEIIKKMHQKFQTRGPFPTLYDEDGVYYAPYIPDETKPKAILIDVDGTAMHISPERGPFDWEKVILDEPNTAVVETVKAMKEAGYLAIVMSGRSDVARQDTLDSLLEAGMPVDALHMRHHDDMRPDWKVKGDLFNEHIRENYNIIYCLDDRNQVVDFYRKTLGLKVFQVDYGNF